MNGLARLLPAALAMSMLTSPTQAPTAKVSVADLREDFSIFCSALEEGHPSMYRYFQVCEVQSPGPSEMSLRKTWGS
jgi:hypothetical protein